jgi:hypothetical protein
MLSFFIGFFVGVILETALFVVWYVYLKTKSS